MKSLPQRRQDGRFVDVTKETGLGDRDATAWGISVADYDADGDPRRVLDVPGAENLLVAQRRRQEVRRASTVRTGRGHVERDDRGQEGDAPVLVDGLRLVRRGRRRRPRPRSSCRTCTGRRRSTSTSSFVPRTSRRIARPAALSRATAPRLLPAAGRRLASVDATEGVRLRRRPSRRRQVARGLSRRFRRRRASTDVFVANDTVQNFLFLNKRQRASSRRVAVAAAVALRRQRPSRALRMGSGRRSTSATTARSSIAIGNFSEEPVSLYTVSRDGHGRQRAVRKTTPSAARIGTADAAAAHVRPRHGRTSTSTAGATS